MAHPFSQTFRNAQPRDRAKPPLAAAALVAALALAGCGGARPQTSVGPARATALSPLGLQKVLGANVRQLTSLFGRPQADVTEGQGRKVQFGNATCVLDAYLYPPQERAEPIVTYVDARKPDGQDADRAACVAALSAR